MLKTQVRLWEAAAGQPRGLSPPVPALPRVRTLGPAALPPVYSRHRSSARPKPGAFHYSLLVILATKKKKCAQKSNFVPEK